MAAYVSLINPSALRGCRAALGEYELGLAYMVITASQRDPGEYMLQLQVGSCSRPCPSCVLVPRACRRVCVLDSLHVTVPYKCSQQHRLNCCLGTLRRLTVSPPAAMLPCIVVPYLLRRHRINWH